MLLFTTTSFESDAWSATRTFADELDGLAVELGVGIGRHGASVRLDGDEAGELVGEATADGDEPVSAFHLPPYYRWRSGRWSCEFVTEWREGSSSIAMSLRHMRSLRRHPRAVVVDDADREASLDGAPASAIVVGTPAESVDSDTGESIIELDWRGWHVLDLDDPFDGPTRRILATHTALARPRPDLAQWR